MSNVITTPDPAIPDTPMRGKIREAKEKRRLDLLEKGWLSDGVWWNSPHTGIRYPFDIACDIEYLREEWKNPDTLDWDRQTFWANQYTEGGQAPWKGEPVW